MDEKKFPKKAEHLWSDPRKKRMDPMAIYRALQKAIPDKTGKP